MSVTRIRGGTIIDPANHARRYTGDLWIRGDRIIQSSPGLRADLDIDATGRFVMPGGVDMHSHFAGPKVNFARQLLARAVLRSETPRSDDIQLVPDIVRTGWWYAGLGYTTAIDAAIAPHATIQAREEMGRMPIVDGNFLIMAGNDPDLLDALALQDVEAAASILRKLYDATGAAGIKLVSPGNVNDWKRGWRTRINDIDQPLRSSSNTPRSILAGMAQAVDRARLPHALHIHCNALGMPGNWQTTLATMKALGDQRGHFAHIQFHSYRGADSEAEFGSAVRPLVEYLNDHPHLTADIGQIMFGPAMAMTGDTPLAHFLQRTGTKPWIAHDVWNEGGCGITPIRYRHQSRIHALQWAIGLEWFLLAANPWQVALSTDHPNGASFLAYPRIIRLLMDREFRAEQLALLPAEVHRDSVLRDLDREYTLEEIAIVTRAAPARILGMPDKGHLGSGAVADVVLYEPRENWEETFRFPRTVFKSGQMVVDDGELNGGGGAEGRMG